MDNGLVDQIENDNVTLVVKVSNGSSESLKVQEYRYSHSSPFSTSGYWTILLVLLRRRHVMHD